MSILKEMVAKNAARKARIQGRQDLEALYPALAKEWAPINTHPASSTHPTSEDLGWWVCSEHGPWQASPQQRVRGQSCSKCRDRANGVTIHRFKEIIASLAPYITHMTPLNVWLILNQNQVLKNRSRERLVDFLTSNRIPATDFLDMVQGKSGTASEALLNGELPEIQGGEEISGDEPPPAPMWNGEVWTIPAGVESSSPPTDPLPSPEPSPSLPAPPVPELEPEVRVMNTMRAGAALAQWSPPEVLEYLYQCQVAKLWTIYFDAEYVDFEREQTTQRESALQPLQAFLSQDDFMGEVARRFLAQHEQVEGVQPPSGYSAVEGRGGRMVPMKLNAMQKLTSIRLETDGRLLNFSGTGAGKTMAGLLAMKHLRSSMTVVVCPFNVMSEWSDKADLYFKGTHVRTRTWDPADAQLLVFNYEWFQDEDVALDVERFMERYGERVGLIILDEVHLAKLREGQDESLRRGGIQSLLDGAPAGTRRLFLSATPIVNDLAEGANLVRMLTGKNPLKSTARTITNCVELNRAFVAHGICWRPTHGVSASLPELIDATRTSPEDGHLVFDDYSSSMRSVVRVWAKNIIPIDMTADLDYILALREDYHESGDVVTLEEGLTMMRLQAISDHIGPGEKVLIYTMLKGGTIIKDLRDSLTSMGHSVVEFTGDQTLKERAGVLARFLGKEGPPANVLICTDAMATGVDGLQHVCSKVIFNVLPWTHMQYEQLIGRVLRKKQRETVQVLVPVIFVTIRGRNWSYDVSKLIKIMEKRTLSDAVMNGNLPDHLRESTARMTKRVFGALDALIARAGEESAC